MTLKRKRSDPDSSPSSASSSSYSTRDSLSPSPSQHAFSFQFQHLSQHFYPRPLFAPSTLHQDRTNVSGRTNKRYRDNRPDEQSIYANTFRKLYEAQRPHTQDPLTTASLPPTTLPEAMDTSEANPRPQPQSEQDLPTQPRSQASLHKFFNISRAPTSNAMPAPMTLGDSTARCQDCEAALEASDDDMMMDGGYDESSPAWGCGRCGRAVCDLCAVVDFGVGRECLMCRMGS